MVKGKRYFVKSEATGHEEMGTASWYGKRFHGRRTSSGERYDMHAMTAAHKNLPISSLIQVTNLDNGLSTLVRVNDRGPFHGNRVLDLSYAAASQLNMVDKGSAKVTIQVVEPGRPKLEKGLQDMFVAASDKARTGGGAYKPRPARPQPRRSRGSPPPPKPTYWAAPWSPPSLSPKPTILHRFICKLAPSRIALPRRVATILGCQT